MAICPTAQFFLLFLREKSNFSLFYRSRESRTNKNLSIIVVYVIRRVYISDITVSGIGYNSTIRFMENNTGIVLHEPDGAVVADAANGYITYVDPTDNVNNNNGKIFVGAAFPATVKEAKVALFPEKEKKELRGGADGHVLAVSDYEPGSEYTYYWGAAWDKADIKTVDAWNEYVAAFAQKLRAPLTVTVQ